MAKPVAVRILKLTGLILVNLLGIGLIYLLALRTGAAFVYFGTVSPDTCWLLKLGSIIANAGAIPKADPFSFTIPLSAAQNDCPPFVVYQWLAEVAFFEAYRVGKLDGLLIAAAAITALAFLALPLRACLRANAPVGWSFLAVAAASATANLRCFLRPEIFSCLFLAVWLSLLQNLRLKIDRAEKPNTDDHSIDWLLIALFTVLMIIWCNLHTGYVSGIVAIAFYAGAMLLGDARARRPLGAVTKTASLSLLASLLASLINPYGVGLWLYLPHLYFAPVNEKIKELQPIVGTQLFEGLHIPFALLLLLCYGAIFWSLFCDFRAKSPRIRSPMRLSSLLIVVVATGLCLAKRRLVSLSALFILFETANFIGFWQLPSVWLPFWCKPVSILLLELAILLLVPRAVHDLAGSVIKLSIPQATEDFSPPLDAVAYFASNYDGGHIFSSLTIADMLDLYFSPRNSLFIDTRFDAFSDQTRIDYETIIHGRDAWRQLLDRYQIAWVFVMPKDEIFALLEREPGWHLVFSRDNARIFKRVQ
jgi:hypothetical protein